MKATPESQLDAGQVRRAPSSAKALDPKGILVPDGLRKSAPAAAAVSDIQNAKRLAIRLKSEPAAARATTAPPAANEPAPVDALTRNQAPAPAEDRLDAEPDSRQDTPEQAQDTKPSPQFQAPSALAASPTRSQPDTAPAGNVSRSEPATAETATAAPATAEPSAGALRTPITSQGTASSNTRAASTPTRGTPALSAKPLATLLEQFPPLQPAPPSTVTVTARWPEEATPSRPSAPVVSKSTPRARPDVSEEALLKLQTEPGWAPLANLPPPAATTPATRALETGASTTAKVAKQETAADAGADGNRDSLFTAAQWPAIRSASVLAPPAQSAPDNSSPATNPATPAPSASATAPTAASTAEMRPSSQAASTLSAAAASTAKPIPFIPMTSGLQQRPHDTAVAPSQLLESGRTGHSPHLAPVKALSQPADNTATPQAQTRRYETPKPLRAPIDAATTASSTTNNTSAADTPSAEPAAPSAISTQAPTPSGNEDSLPTARDIPQLQPGSLAAPVGTPAEARAELIAEANQCLVSLMQTQQMTPTSINAQHHAAIQAETARRRAFDMEFLDRIRRATTGGLAALGSPAMSEQDLAAVYSELQRRAMIDAGLLGPGEDLPEAANT